MFSFKGLADKAKEFEAALFDEAPPSNQPNPRRPRISTPTTPTTPTGSTGTPILSPTSIIRSESPLARTGSANSTTSNSELADQALNNLRASFRKGRVSSEVSVKSQALVNKAKEQVIDKVGSLEKKEKEKAEVEKVIEKVVEPEVVVTELSVENEKEEEVETSTKEEVLVPVEESILEVGLETKEIEESTKESPVVVEEGPVEPPISASKKKKNKKKSKSAASTAEPTPVEGSTRSNSPIPEVEKVHVAEVPVSMPDVIALESSPVLEAAVVPETVASTVEELVSPSVEAEIVAPITEEAVPVIAVATSSPPIDLKLSPSIVESNLKPSPPSPPPLSPPTNSKHNSTASRDSVDLASSSKDNSITEITQAYERLQELKSGLDKIVSEITTLSGVSDLEAFEGELRNMKGKSEMSMTEIGRLSAELTKQKVEIKGLVASHQISTTSQSEQLATLTLQLSEKDTALKLLNTQLSESETKVKVGEEAQVKGVEEYEKLKIVAKEEEEKRVKALSLLRALRQKLVKSEKDKEEGEKEREELKASEVSTQDVLKADRARFDQEVISLRAAQESQLSKMRQAFERETTSIRLQYERETTARKGQYELDAITLKSSHVKELSTKDTRIKELEGKIREMTISRDGLFDQLQLKTAEAESASSHQESLTGQTNELKYELKEVKDKSAALKEEVEELRRARRDVTRDDANTRKLLGETEARHEAKLKELTTRAKQLEKDRQETEVEMGSNLQERMREVERMRQEIIQKDLEYAEATRTRLDRDTKIEEAEAMNKDLVTKLSASQSLLEHSREETIRLSQAEAAVREELRDRMDRASELETRLEEIQTKESTLRSNNKILRDELRKLQSGVLLSEKQRNPGVGYFASPSFSLATPQTTSAASIPLSPSVSEAGTPTRTGSVSSEMNRMDSASNGDEALNFEYIRNVILQFLERPEMRTHLVSVLGVILHFTPAEARRLTFGSKQN